MSDEPVHTTPPSPSSCIYARSHNLIPGPDTTTSTSPRSVALDHLYLINVENQIRSGKGGR
jgi:hypothetical protein